MLTSEYVKIEVSDNDKETAKAMEGETAKYLWWNRGVGRPVGTTKDPFFFLQKNKN